MTSDSFYTAAKPELRFGDIVQGCVVATPRVSLAERAGEEDGDQGFELKFDVEILRPNFAVILTPCCEISNEFLLTAPLEPIPYPRWLSNPYLAEDFLRMNDIMTREQAAAPEEQQTWTPETLAKVRNEPPGYAFRSYFVYPGRTSSEQVLPEYTIKGNRVDAYVIDFRHATVLKHDLKPLKKHIVGQKYREMSALARESLRKKLSDYYRKIPDEDRVLLAT